MDLTQKDLADFVGCPVSAIIKIETGARKPSRQIAERLLQYLQVPAEERQPFLNLARTDPSTTEARPTNLPGRVTSLVGREQEIAIVRNLLLEGSRIVTLVGPGGIGKTRLSIEVGTALLDAFIDGLFFVPLATIRDPDLVPSAIAQALEVTETANQPLLDTLKRHLHYKQMLLVLDNFEQVTEAAPLAAELLAAVPRLRMMVTSRSVLHIYGEQQFIVPPLGMPDHWHASSPAGAGSYEAVRLFVGRARLIKPDFDIADNEQPVPLWRYATGSTACHSQSSWPPPG